MPCLLERNCLGDLWVGVQTIGQTETPDFFQKRNSVWDIRKATAVVETWNRGASTLRLPRGSPSRAQLLTAGHSYPEASLWRDRAQNPQRQLHSCRLVAWLSSGFFLLFFSLPAPLPRPSRQKSVIPAPPLLPHASVQDPPTLAPKALTCAPTASARVPKKERYKVASGESW